MRQVNEAELVWNVKYALRRGSARWKKGLSSSERSSRDAAEQLLAQEIVSHLRRYEVLSDAPLPENADLFSRAAYSDPTLPLSIGEER